MCTFVVPVLLLLGSDSNRNFSCISKVLEDPVESIGIDRIFWLSVSFSHQIIQEFLDKMLLAGVSFNQIQHVIDKNLSGFDVQLQ